MSLEAFAKIVRQDEARIDLARACLMIAQDAYPALDIDRYVGEIDRLGRRLGPRPASVEAGVLALNELLFADLGYHGNLDDYYDPCNSYLNDVIDRRTGIPITLSILYLEVGRRAGLPLEGVSFPGHFLVRAEIRGHVLVLDPFDGGAPQSEHDLRERLKRVIPEGAAAEGPVAELPLDQFLEPASKRHILMRVLRNLKAIHQRADRPEAQLAVLNRMLALAPDSGGELRDRGYVYQRLECWQPALKDLTEYLEREPDAADLDEVRMRMMELRSLCARMS
jgi:regulator of sirC expression with transglutaminase-like and TPR domain